MTILLDGKKTAEEMRADITARVAALKSSRGVTPGLAVVLVGDDAPSVIYTRTKAKTAEKCGMHDELHHLPATTGEAEILDLIARLNADPRVHGILVQLPLPDAVDENRVIASISPRKDADGFHPENVGRLHIGLPAPIPCTPLGVIALLDRFEIPLSGRDAVVLGRSNIVGKPMATLLTARHATVTVCHSRTKDLPGHVRRADIVVSAMGRPKMVTGDMVKDGVVAVDVGINRLPDGKLVGDFDYETVAPRAAAITPVPGGVGPMTITMLMKNVLTLAENCAGGA